MRTQLAVPDNELVTQDFYNQLFTMHGTTMMFLFAVPAMEALGVMLLPQMLAARDLPFPRLSAFAIWAYVIGGTVFFLTIFFDLSPKGGWFMYPPLTLMEFSPAITPIFGCWELALSKFRRLPARLKLLSALCAPGRRVCRWINCPSSVGPC